MTSPSERPSQRHERSTAKRKAVPTPLFAVSLRREQQGRKKEESECPKGAGNEHGTKRKRKWNTFCMIPVNTFCKNVTSQRVFKAYKFTHN